MKRTVPKLAANSAFCTASLAHPGRLVEEMGASGQHQASLLHHLSDLRRH
jgi:hypothetical protein